MGCRHRQHERPDVKPIVRKFTDKEESAIRGEIRRGVPHAELCAKYGIKIQRLRRIACGPLSKMSYAIEGFQKP